MFANHNRTASQLLGRAETPDWTDRLGTIVRTVVEAMDTGRTAQHDYRKLAVHGIAPQDAARAVLQTHFGKRS